MHQNSKANQMIPNGTSKMSWGFQQTRPEVRGWTSYCRYLITENVWSNFIINSTSLSLSLDPTLSCYRHPLTATIVATGLLALYCYGVFLGLCNIDFGSLELWFPELCSPKRAFILYRTFVPWTLIPKTFVPEETFDFRIWVINFGYQTQKLYICINKNTAD